MKHLSDIDIDTKTSFEPLNIFPTWIKCSVVKNEELFSHPCGIHPQNVSIDQVTGLSAIPYKEAEDLGFNKIDFLHLNIYDHFNSREEIDELLKIEPDWNILLIPSEQKKLFQLSKHGAILNAIKPNNIDELADVLALIRPGKKNLLDLYKHNKKMARRLLYAKDESGYTFKKSHAVAYALVLVLQLHLIKAGTI